MNKFFDNLLRHYEKRICGSKYQNYKVGDVTAYEYLKGCKSNSLKAGGSEEELFEYLMSIFFTPTALFSLKAPQEFRQCWVRCGPFRIRRLNGKTKLLDYSINSSLFQSCDIFYLEDDKVKSKTIRGSKPLNKALLGAPRTYLAISHFDNEDFSLYLNFKKWYD